MKATMNEEQILLKIITAVIGSVANEYPNTTKIETNNTSTLVRSFSGKIFFNT